MSRHGEHARHVNLQVKATKAAEAVGKLELNPAGQHDWLQKELPGLTIAAEIANLLTRPSTAAIADLRGEGVRG